MELLWISLIVVSLLGMLVVFRLSNRTPRCRRCRAATVVVSDEVVETIPPVLQLVFRCPQCGEVIRRRAVGAFWE